MAVPVYNVLGDLGSFAPIVHDFGNIYEDIFDHSTKLKPEINRFIKGFEFETGTDLDTLTRAAQGVQEATQIASQGSPAYKNAAAVEDIFHTVQVCQSKIQCLLEREKENDEKRAGLVKEQDAKWVEEKAALIVSTQAEMEQATKDFKESEALLLRKFTDNQLK